MDKSPDAFRTISEVAEDLDVPQHVLRFWETRFPQIRPLKRGGGRRYYRPDDVLLLQGIRRLLYGEGYTIKGVQRILKEQGIRQVQAIGRGAPLVTPPDDHNEDRVAEHAPQAGGAAINSEDDFNAGEGDGMTGVILADEALSALKTVYVELGECRRVLDDALRQVDAAEDEA